MPQISVVNLTLVLPISDPSYLSNTNGSDHIGSSLENNNNNIPGKAFTQGYMNWKKSMQRSFSQNGLAKPVTKWYQGEYSLGQNSILSQNWDKDQDHALTQVNLHSGNLSTQSLSLRGHICLPVHPCQCFQCRETKSVHPVLGFYG